MLKKQVLIDATKLADRRIDGVKRYTQELLRALLPLAQSYTNEWELSVCWQDLKIYKLLDVADYLEAGKPLPATSALTQRYPRFSSAWQAGRRQLAEMLNAWPVAHARWVVNRFWTRYIKRWPDYDLLHLLLPNTAWLYYTLHTRWLTTVHDLSHVDCPAYQTPRNIRTLQDGLRCAVAHDSMFVSVSEFTKTRLQQYYDLGDNQVEVIYEGCDNLRFHPQVSCDALTAVRSKYKLPATPYLLCVGTLEPRKNLLNTIRAFTKLVGDHPALNVSLVIVGAYGWGDITGLQPREAEGPRIHFTGFVADSDLPTLYAGATALSYVSFYEGFGLPPVEAMSCGVPVVYGNLAALPEIVAEAGLPANPYDVDDIKEQFYRLLCDTSLRQTLAHKAGQRALRFRWPHVAQQTLDLYERCLAQPRLPGRLPRW